MMNGNHEMKELPIGRVRTRAHSMLFTFKAAGKEKGGGAEQTRGHLPAEPLHEGTVHDGKYGAAGVSAQTAVPARRRIPSGSSVSALTMALRATGARLPTASKPIAIKSTADTSIDGTLPAGYRIDSGSDSDDSIPDIVNARADLRKWCTGQPPKKSFLGSDGRLPARLPFTRRSTLAEKPELDILLAATKKMYNGHMYLPLSAQTVHRLSPYWKGEKPIADTKIFECIMMTHEVNGVHADHVVSALERIGAHCEHLLVVSPIQTSELGNVFNREAGDIAPGNDWEHILSCFPNLKRLVFVHPLDEPVMLSRGTFYALHTAVANRQAARELKTFKYEGPPQLITNFHYDMAVAVASATSIN